MGFRKVFSLETRRFLGKRKVVFLLMFFLLGVYLIQSGIGAYKSSLEEIKRFQEFEKTRIENFQYYPQYGTYGFRLLYVPGPLSALFNNAGIFSTNLNAFIDSGERMKIYEPFKGKNAFIGYTSIFLNLSGLLFLLGSLLALFYGLESFRDRAFLKLLDSIGSRKKLFWSVLASRLFLALAYLFLIMVTTWLLYLINGVSVGIGELAIYGLVVFLMVAFFLLVGMLAGALKNRQVSLVAVFVVWLLFVFGLPALVGKIVYSRAETITSAYEMDIENFKLMMSIEKKALEQAGEIDLQDTKNEIIQKLNEYFWNNEFKQIFNHEQGMIDDMKEVISLHHNLSLIFPTSFFLSVNNEVSGRGYGNLIAFYEYVLKHKKGFVQFYASKSFFEGAKKVESYIKGDENVFRAPSLLPGNFGFGLFIGLSWLFLLLFLNWLAFCRLLNRLPLPDAEESEDPRYLKQDEFKTGRVTAVMTFSNTLLIHFLETLKNHGNPHVFTPGSDSMPGDIRVKNLFAFFGVPVPEILKETAGKYIDDLKKEHKAVIVVEVVRLFEEIEFIIFNDFLAGLSKQFSDYFVDVLKDLKSGRKIVYFTNSIPGGINEDDIIKRVNDRQPLLI